MPQAITKRDEVRVRRTHCLDGVSVSHSAFGLGALAGAVFALLGLAGSLAHRAGRFGRAVLAHRAAFEQASSSVLLVDARTLQIVDANFALQRSTSYTHREICSLPLAKLLVDGRGEPAPLAGQLCDSVTRRRFSGIQVRAKDGQLRNVEVSGHRVEMRHRQLLALTLSDMAPDYVDVDLLAMQSRRDHLAHHDQLTGVPDRLFFFAHLPGALEQACRDGTPLAVLSLDLDRFKHINDSRGHESGDRVLNTLAARLQACMQPGDVVVRMGGDEFVAILKSIKSEADAHEIATRIKETLAQPVALDGRALMTTVSIGVTVYPRDSVDMHQLLRNADAAMSQAKEQGRNNLQFWSAALGRRLDERTALEASLRSALLRRQLDVHYQPIVDIHSHRVVALECLLRWTHPTQGFVAPDRFIAIAEETGLIVPMGEFVLEHVIEDLGRWQAAGCKVVPVAINISAVQLQRSDVPETISRMTARHGVSPRMLQVELTESAAFEGEANEDAVTRLRELGVQIAIDDFGTGYSSLSYLKRWRVDYLKIDRSFVRDLVTDKSDLAIVGAIIAMARHLNIEIIAEGIESWPQLTKLQELGSTFAQGYLFARPVPADQCRRYLSGAPLEPPPPTSAPSSLSACSPPAPDPSDTGSPADTFAGPGRGAMSVSAGVRRCGP